MGTNGWEQIWPAARGLPTSDIDHTCQPPRPLSKVENTWKRSGGVSERHPATCLTGLTNCEHFTVFKSFLP